MKKQILAVVLISLQALLASHVSAQQGSGSPASQPAANGSGSGVSEQKNDNQVLPKQENVVGKSNSSAFEGEYSKWLFILSDNALQYRFRQIKVVEDSADFEVQFRINFEDKIFCDHPNCLGYTLAFGVPNKEMNGTKYYHFKFFNSFKGVFTLPNPIRLRMKFPDGSYRFLTANGFMYSNSTGDRTGASEPFYDCVDQINKNPNVSNRCEGARAWRDIFIEEKAITIE